MYAEDDLIPISSLQHLAFCERQFALIHVEQLWADNRFTAEGEVLHERVDDEHRESRRLFRQEYAMAVRSLELGIIGKCDLVEFHLRSSGGIAEAVPVEFKRGRDKETDVDRVQLCAQALCIEEMLGIEVPRGDFYYLGARRRTSAELSTGLRAATKGLVDRARAIIESGATPAAVYESRKCDRCSLLDLCMPKALSEGGRRVSRYIKAAIAAIRKECV